MRAPSVQRFFRAPVTPRLPRDMLLPRRTTFSPRAAILRLASQSPTARPCSMVHHAIARLWAESSRYIRVTGLVFFVMLAVLFSWKTPRKEAELIARKEAEGRWVRPELLVPVWLHKGWGMSTAGAGLLLLCSPWLGRRRTTSMRFHELPSARPRQKYELAGVAALMIFGAWQSYPRLFHSLWGDEEYDIALFV